MAFNWFMTFNLFFFSVLLEQPRWQLQQPCLHPVWGSSMVNHQRVWWRRMWRLAILWLWWSVSMTRTSTGCTWPAAASGTDWAGVTRTWSTPRGVPWTMRSWGSSSTAPARPRPWSGSRPTSFRTPAVSTTSAMSSSASNMLEAVIKWYDIQ